MQELIAIKVRMIEYIRKHPPRKEHNVCLMPFGVDLSWAILEKNIVSTQNH